MAIDRRLLIHVDWVTLGATLLLGAISVATIFSATQATRFSGLYLKQALWFAIALAGLVIVLSLDYRRLADRAPLFYAGVLGLLAYVLLLGPRVAGTRRWFFVAGLQVQPSELAKLVAALLLAKVFAEYRKSELGLGDIIAPATAIGLLAVLIAAEPDLGTAFCLVPMFLGVALLAGLRLRAFAALLVALMVVGGLGWRFGLKYQKERIYTFLDPGRDPRGSGYHTIQSQIAVGSGGLLGKGFGKGSQTQLGYLPARHTDFVLSVLAEEFGFLGVAGVLSLYLLIFWRAFATAALARDRAGALLAAALASAMLFQVVYNVAMVAGLVPVKGLPLPLMSYGGASLLSSLLAIGLILNVRMRRFAN